MKKYTLTPDEIYVKSTLTSADIKPISTENPIIGQDEALDALNFGIQMRATGYNIFCTGIKGVGRTTLTLQAIKEYASKQKTPDDWCFLHNFEIAHQPIAVNFAPGQGKAFAKDVKKMVNALKLALPPVFADEMYKIQAAHIAQHVNKQKEEYFQNIEKQINAPNVTLLEVEGGITVAPVKKGKILTAKTFNVLPKDERKDILEQLTSAQEILEQALKQIPNWEIVLADNYANFNIKLAENTLKSIITPVKKTYAKNTVLATYFDYIWQDIIDNLNLFILPVTPKNMDAINEQLTELWNRYNVNLLITNKPDSGAPVVHLNHPTLANLLGKIERQQFMGSLIADFSLIRSGALHQANGGFLIIEAKELLANMHVWNALKRSLFSKQIKIESAGDDTSVFSVVSLVPAIIPLNTKVVLIGDANIYYSLMEQDDEFGELFKIQSRYQDKMPRTPESESAYAKILLEFAKKEKLKPFSLDAMRRLLEHASRETNDNQKLSTCMVHINDIMREANFIATQKKAKTVDLCHIDTALNDQHKRINFMQDEISSMIQKNVIAIETSGKKVGQLNALVVHEYASFSFGRPNRVTCQVKMGHGELIDIEREAELGGALHSKGILILSAFLSGRLGTTEPLSIDASLAFEQSYSELDGDSASSTELYCLLSAIGNLPLNQAIATTGSVNQFGEIQAVGGVNEKIEGFFDVCASRGLTGEHGVIIPKSTLHTLMLKPEVVTAVKENKFKIYAISTIDEGLQILTGKPLSTITTQIKKQANDFFKRSQEIDSPSGGKKGK